MSGKKYAVSAGHIETAKSAQKILENGGNAYDAILASFLTASVVEPVLSSLGGGGFLTAKTKDESILIYDFFTQTPLKKKRNNIEFFPIIADFGEVKQEFHIGAGSIATPGGVKGLIKIHKDLGIMPLKEIAAPAIDLAKKGIRVNAYQSFIFDIIGEIYKAGEESFQIFKSHKKEGYLKREGEILKMSDLANAIEQIVAEGDDVFYKGEIAQKIVKLSEERGGYLTMDDLKNYEVIIRKPLKIKYRQNYLLTNPPVSAGGILISFALKLLEKIDLKKIKYGSAEFLENMILTMKATDKARIDKLNGNLEEKGIENKFLDKDLIDLYFKEVFGQRSKFGGTTHISVIDEDENMASMTVTNGEGSSYMIPGTGIMLNNMLGEEDLNPNGFHNWQENQRISSMVSPSILFNDKMDLVIGSAGSNRIRTAILQTIVNICDYEKSINEAINGPRLHFEGDVLNIEKGFDKKGMEKILEKYKDANVFSQKNLFFGGVNAVGYDKERKEFFGSGDCRRQGVAIINGKIIESV